MKPAQNLRSASGSRPQARSIQRYQWQYPGQSAGFVDARVAKTDASPVDFIGCFGRISPRILAAVPS
jgi:hypothetical protein